VKTRLREHPSPVWMQMAIQAHEENISSEWVSCSPRR
jgi:hypothetical protein